MAKARKARKVVEEETLEVAETEEEIEDGLTEEAEEVEEAPAEKAPEAEKKEDAPAEEPKPERRGLFPGKTRQGGFEMKPFKGKAVDCSPVADVEEAVERVGGEEMVKSTKVLSDKVVVVYGDNFSKAVFPIAAQ